MSPTADFRSRALRALCLSVLITVVGACDAGTAKPGAQVTSAAGATACPATDLAGFVAAFADDPALQRAFTAATVDTAFVDMNAEPEPVESVEPLSRDRLHFPVMPDRAAQRRDGLQYREVGTSGDRTTVVLEKPDTDAQLRYVFRRDAVCWTLVKIVDPAFGKAFPGEAPAAPAIDNLAIVREVMRSRYGDHYDAERDCWPTTLEENGDTTDYCLRPQAPTLVTTSTGRQMLFLAAGVQDFDHTPRLYSYAALDPGMFGLFVVALHDDGSWSLVAGTNDETIGTNGDCACATARLVRMGRDVYGWTMVDGGIWQGVEVSSHSVYAPVGDKVVLVASVPDVEEDAQGVHHDIAFDTTDPAAERYPLIVTTRGGTGGADRRTMRFDAAAGRYPATIGH